MRTYWSPRSSARSPIVLRISCEKRESTRNVTARCTSSRRYGMTTFCEGNFLSLIFSCIYGNIAAYQLTDFESLVNVVHKCCASATVKQIFCACGLNFFVMFNDANSVAHVIWYSIIILCIILHKYYIIITNTYIIFLYYTNMLFHQIYTSFRKNIFPIQFLKSLNHIRNEWKFYLQE